MRNLNGTGKADGNPLAIISQEQRLLTKITGFGSGKDKASILILVSVPGMIDNGQMNRIAVTRHHRITIIAIFHSILIYDRQDHITQVKDQVTICVFPNGNRDLKSAGLFIELPLVSDPVRHLLIVHRAGLFRDLRRVLVLCNLNCPGFLLTYIQGVT